MKEFNTEWSNLAKIIFRRTYARKDNGTLENWNDTVERVIRGNVKNFNVSSHEIERLRYFMLNRKAGPAGRGWWFSGSPAHDKLGGAGLVNCWHLSCDDIYNFVIAQDLLMLGGGVGMSVEHKYVSKLPKVKKDAGAYWKNTADADFIVPDSREGWCKLTQLTLESFFVTGKPFSYSTICVRGKGEQIKGFGGVSSGPLSLVNFVEKLCSILQARAGKHLRPLDCADVICAIGEMVVAGNVRRSAILIQGDAWDKDYLKAKRWDLGTVPSQRAMANFSVVCDDVEDLHPLFWKTYEHGEPFGIINIKNTQKYGRMGELRKDTATGFNPCGEASLQSGESCNLQELPLPNLASPEEFYEGSRLMHRWGKRVSCERIHHQMCDDVVSRNRRIGTGITGCLMSPLFAPEYLDEAYYHIQKENVSYSQELGIPESIRTTVVKPSGTMSKLMDMYGYEGIHPAYSRYFIQRVRFALEDPLIPLLREAGHHIEPVIRLDGTYDHGTQVVDFYIKAPDGMPVADEGWDTWKQLDVLKMAQRHWADQSVSVTVYYRKEEIPQLREWLSENLDYIKTISFLCHNDHGFKQAPKETITEEQFEKFGAKIMPLELDMISEGDLESQECSAGSCPIK
jgi:ribonucleoside-triphosphate reductase